jgi:hypothetical protein
MPLDRQLIQTGFSFGVQEGVDPHHVPFGVLTRAENVRWAKSNRIEKRYGVSALPTGIVGGGNIANGARLFARGGELNVIDGASLYSYSSYGWRRIGVVPNVGVTTRTLVDQASGVSVADVATYQDGSGATLAAVLWATGNPRSVAMDMRAQFAVYDVASGATVVPPTLLAGANAFNVVRLAVVGSTIVILYIANNGGSLYIGGHTFSTTTLTVSGPTTIVSSTQMSAASSFDATSISATQFAIAYLHNSGDTRVRSYDTSFALQNSFSVVSTAGQVCLGGDSTNLYFGLGANLRVLTPSTLALASGPTPIPSSASPSFIGFAPLSSTTAIALWRDSVGTLRNTNSQVITSGAAFTASTLRATQATLPMSRPFVQGGACYAILADDPFGASSYAGQNTYLVECESATSSYVEPHRYVAKVEHAIGGALVLSAPGVGVSGSGSSFYTVAPFLSTIPNTVNSWLQGLRLVTVTTGASLPADTWRTVVYGQDAYMAGGFLGVSDGFQVFDHGFARAPIVVNVATSATGSMAAGNYLYGYHLEFKAKTGTLHRSTTVTRQVASVPASGRVTSDVSYVNVTAKNRQSTNGMSPVSLPTFRSVVSGSTPQRLTIDPAVNATTVDVLQSLQTIADTRADASIDGSGTTLASRPVQYTVGGILDDVQPPGFLTLTLHRQRLWGVANDGRSLWYSKSFLDDVGTAPGFNEALRITTDETVTALASMDDKLIIFSRDGISYLLGDGPAANGTQGDFSNPNGIQTDVGCTSARSVVSTPDGVMFQSITGISLLTRGLEVVWLGRPVQDVLASYPNVTSAVLVSRRNEVRFTCSDAARTSSRVLVWNYVEKQWSVSTYLAGAAIADACIWNDAWTMLTTAGAVYVETATDWTDAGTYVPMLLETAWVSASGPLAFQAVRELQLEGVSNSNHDLTVEVGFDSESAYAQTRTFLAGSDVTAIGDFEELNITIGTRRKCNHIRFRISDATPTTPGTYPVGTGRGPSFDAMGIEVGMKRGFATNPATKRG